MIDGEAVVVDERGLSVFDALRYRLRSLSASIILNWFGHLKAGSHAAAGTKDVG